MRSEENARSYWIVLLGSFAGAAVLGVSAVALVMRTFISHSSLFMGVLRIGLAATLLFLAAFLIAVGTLYCMSINDDSR